MSDTTIEKKEGPKAKDVSLKSMIIAAIWVGVLTLAKAFWGLISDKAFGLSVSEIVFSGMMIAAVFSPVYLSIVLEKIKDLKVG
jgi:nitrate/nitrite transporter NarK